MEVLEAILNRIDRVDDWTYKLFVWVRGAIIALLVLGALSILSVASI